MLDAFLIDRQSAQDFANWGARLGEALGCPLPLRHIAERAPVTQFTLQSRKDYGADLQAATAILRFGLSGDTNGGARSWWSRHHRLPHFAAGDLVGVLPPGSDLPRFYSLASGSAENFLEVCVRKQPGGLCSGFLHDLQPGDSIEAFIRANPRFRPSPGTAPLILVGAGAGIAPLMGFIRANASNRPMHLYWGGRSPDTDFLYSEELKACLRDKRLSQLHAVFSRVAHGRYVQSEVLAQAAVIGALLKEGAQIMVCGGRDMGEQVARAFDAILRHAGLDLETLREQGRYCEDIY